MSTKAKKNPILKLDWNRRVPVGPDGKYHVYRAAPLDGLERPQAPLKRALSRAVKKTAGRKKRSHTSAIMRAEAPAIPKAPERARKQTGQPPAL